MRRAILALAVLAPACGVGGPDFWAPPDELSWALDPTCLTPTVPELREVRWGATELWRMVGVHTEPADGAPDVWVCLRAGAPRPGYSGWQSWRDDGTAEAEVSRTVALDRLAAVVAHEIGHVILPGTGDEDHLPAGEVGILAASTSGHSWSEADEEFLATFGGFIPVVRAF